MKKLYFLNYANDSFKSKQKWNSLSAKILGKVSSVIEYGPEDIDLEFKAKNKEIFSVQAGSGLWLWKPYLIDKQLKLIQENDYIFYCDSGSLIIKNLNEIVSIAEKNKIDMMFFHSPLVEIQWTKKKVFEKLNCDSLEHYLENQIVGGYFLVKNTLKTRLFFKEYLELCTSKELLDNSFDKNEEQNLFIAHRNDQSILSILIKKNKIKSYRDPSDYGQFPLRYLTDSRLFLIKKDDLIKKTYILGSRKENQFSYLLKYIVRSILSSLRIK